MRERQQQESKRGAATTLERKNRVGGRAGEKRASGVGREAAMCERCRGTRGRRTEPRQRKGLPRYMDRRPEQLRCEPRPRLREGLEQASVCVGVGAEPVGGCVDRPADEEGGTVVEWVGQRGRWLDELQIEVERVEERRRRGKGVNRGADIVTEARQRKLCRPRSSTDRLLRLEDENRMPRLGDRDGGGEAVRARADDNRV